MSAERRPHATDRIGGRETVAVIWTGPEGIRIMNATFKAASASFAILLAAMSGRVLAQGPGRGGFGPSPAMQAAAKAQTESATSQMHAYLNDIGDRMLAEATDALRPSRRRNRPSPGETRFGDASSSWWEASRRRPAPSSPSHSIRSRWTALPSRTSRTRAARTTGSRPMCMCPTTRVRFRR